MPAFAYFFWITHFITLASGLWILGMQAGAWRRQRHGSFRALVASSVACLASFGLSLFPYLAPVPEAAALALAAACLLYLAGAVLALAGTVWLFDSYRVLAAQAGAGTGHAG